MTQMTMRAAGLFALLSLFMAGEAAAAVCTSLSAGTWNTAGRWSCGHVPVPADTVVVAHNITLNNSYTIAGLTVNSGVTLADDGNGQFLTVTGNLVVNGTISNGARINVTGAASNISGTGGTFADSRLYTSGTAVTIAAGSTLNFTGAARIYTGRTEGGATVTGSVLTINGTINSTVTAGTTTFLRLYANNTVIGSTGVINASVSAATYNLGTAGVTNNGSVSLNVITRNSASNFWTQGANSSLTVSAVSTVGTFNAHASGNTVTYNGTSTVIAPSAGYWNLAGTIFPGACPVAYTISGTSPCPAGGPVSVTLSPGTCVDDATLGTTIWGGLANVGSSNNLYATTTTAATIGTTLTHYLKCTNYGFAIPAGAIINGISVSVERNISSTNRTTAKDNAMRIVKAGVIGATDRSSATNYTMTDVAVAHGGTADLWGLAWTPAEINATNFGAAFSASVATTRANARTVSVDHMPITVTYTAGTPVDHIRIEHNGGACSGTGAPAQITLKACSDAACSTLYSAADVTGISLSPTGGVYTWTPANPQAILSISGGINSSITLASSTAGTATLAITGTPSPAPSNAYECYNTNTGVSGDCNLVFASDTFTYNVPDHTSGTRQVITLTSCKGAFANKTRSVKFWSTYTDPATGTQQGKVVAGTGDVNCITGYSNLATSSVTPTALSLAFGAGTTPQATFSLCYPDVGKVKVDARYDGSAANGDAGVVLLGNDSFIAKPDHFDVTGIIRTSDSLANPAVTPAPGSPETEPKFLAAGVSTEPTTQFTATVTAKNALGATTPNFGRETVPEGVVLTAAVVAPASGNNGLLTCKGSTTDCVVPGGVANFTGGATTITDLAWSEIGILRVLPTIRPKIVGLLGDYLATGDVSTPTFSSNIGRFYPHHFGVTPGAIDNRADWCAGGVLVSDGTTACAPNFTYMGEPFNANFILSALNFSNGVTQNYTGVFAKLDPLAANNTLVFGAVDGATPTSLTARLNTAQVVVDGSGSFTGGIAAISVPLDITRNVAADGPYAALDIGIAPVDSDGVATVLDLDTNGDTVMDRTQVNSATTEVRYGRIKLSNAHGSELLALPLTAAVQFWNGTFWVNNAADVETTLQASDFALAFPAGTVSKPNNLAACETALAVAGVSPTFTLNLSKPGNGNNGWTDLTLNLGAVAAGNRCTVVGGAGAAATTANQPWLQFPVGTNPTARATFGIDKGSDGSGGFTIIDMRENY